MSMLPRKALLALVLLSGVAGLAGCGHGSSASDASGQGDGDPVGLAIRYGEAAATCDIEHTRFAISYGAGWTAYTPGSVAGQRHKERRAQAALSACRRHVEAGSRVTAQIQSRT